MLVIMNINALKDNTAYWKAFTKRGVPNNWHTSFVYSIFCMSYT